MGAERDRVAGFGRLDYGLRQGGDWYRWGPYVSERQWGTVREDYSADGDAWNYLSHEAARSRAYRWGEDALAGFCDIHQRLCLGLALWNGADPILKERLFGLTSRQGNHGEDVKEYWWYLDAIPSHAWNRWRYHYPQAEFPYSELIAASAAGDRSRPEFELLDAGAFDANRYWIVEVDYAKAGPDDLLMRISVTNAGAETATLHVLPTAWFRNTWACGEDETKARPRLTAVPGAGPGRPAWATVAADHPLVGDMRLLAGPGPDGGLPDLLFCDNETNTELLYDAPPITPYPKDGIGDHVISGAATVNPAETGTKCSAWYRLTLGGAQSGELRLRLMPAAARTAAAGSGRAERTWPMSGGPGQPPPPAQRLTGRNCRWRSFDASDIMSMPDKSCHRTGCARCRPGTGSIRTRSTSRATAPRSTTSPPSPRRRCSAGTRTGEARSGSRSTTW
jgi:hypothetical protein